MALKTKVDGAWREASSLKVKINGEWKDISTLYSKKDGAWVTVYSSGALITFTNYPYPIPVATGWKYSTDRVNWTTVTSDSTINTSGTFTGYVKAKGTLTLSDYYTEHVSASYGNKVGTSLSTARYTHTSFSNGNIGYVCGGYRSSFLNTVEKYDESGNRTSGANLDDARQYLTSFVNASRGYVCGGLGDRVYYSTVDVYDSNGIKQGITYELSLGRHQLTSFVNAGYGYVCGGNGGTGYSATNTVDRYNSSGIRSTGTSMGYSRANATSFSNSNKGYVCGGVDASASNCLSGVDVYDSSGNRTTGAALSVGRTSLTSFANGNKGYVCGGSESSGRSAVVDVYDASGNRTTGKSLSVARDSLTSFVINNYGYVCGGGVHSNVVDIYTEAGIRSTGKSLSVGRKYLTSFTIGYNGYVCGGTAGSVSKVVDVYYDIPESYSAKIPITGGSTYTLNGESGTADVSKIMEFDSKASGTIKYKKGTVPSS